MTESGPSAPGGSKASPEVRRSLFAPETDPHRRGREAVDRVLSDLFMAFLSILLLPIILLPLFVSLPDYILQLLEIGDATIVAFFIIEYGAKLYLAKDRRGHFVSPWHLLDLAIVVLSVVSYLPIAGLNGKGSYALLARLIRLPRALAVAGRTAGSRVQGTHEEQGKAEAVRPTVIRQLDADLKTRHDRLTWEELAQRLEDGKPEWIDIHDVTPEGIARLSKLLKVPEQQFKTRVVDEIFPHVVYVQKVSFLFVQSGRIHYPQVPEHYLRIERSGIVTIAYGPKTITVSPHGLDLFERVLGSEEGVRKEGSFASSVLYSIQRSLLEESRSIFDDIEVEFTKVAGMPRDRLPRDFLERMYALDREVARLSSNLLHFKQMLSVIVSRKLPVEGFDDRAQEDFQLLVDEAGAQGEISDDLSERIHSTIELYMNEEAFETNRILKILAVITSLAVIPSAVSGILGENILGLPFQAQLWEVVLGMALSMSFILYCFIKLGWLKI